MDLENAYDKIYRYIYFRIKDQATAEDITQETFLRFISRKGSIHDYEIRYLYTIARNLCIDEYRRFKPEPIPEDPGDINGPGDNGLTGSGADDLAERIAIRDALSKLPEEDQEILLLRYVNNESVGTISNALGISRFALYRRIKSAEEQLQAYLGDNGYEK